MLTKVGGLGFEVESVEGTAETIVAADMILVRDPVVGRDPDMEERNVVRNVPDLLAPKKGGTSCPVTFSVEIKGSGTAGTAPSVLDDILESMGLDETVDAGVSVKYVPNSDLSTQLSGTAKRFLDGKQVTATGVKGNGTFNVVSGKIPLLEYDGQGVLAADGDTAVLAAPTDSPKPPVSIGTTIDFGENDAAILHEDLDGAVEIINEGAANNLRLGITIPTDTAARRVSLIRLNLQVIGTPASETDGVQLSIQGDTAGDPDGVPITNGSVNVATSNISSGAAEWVDFRFTVGSEPTLTASTVYHIVIEGDWTASATDGVQCDTDVVAAGSQICQYYDAAWAALALKNISVMMITSPATPVREFIDGFELAMNNEVSLRQDPASTEGWLSARITGRNMVMTVRPLEKLDSVRDWFGELAAETDFYFSMTINTTAGEIVKFTFTHMLHSMAGTWDDRDGEVTHPNEFFLEDPADFELRFT